MWTHDIAQAKPDDVGVIQSVITFQVVFSSELRSPIGGVDPQDYIAGNMYYARSPETLKDTQGTSCVYGVAAQWIVDAGDGSCYSCCVKHHIKP
jgi:hypothetical protein